MDVRRLGVALSLGMLAAGAAGAGHENAPAYIYAPVVGVEPIVRHVTVERPREECWEEVVYEPYHHDRPFTVAGPAIAGGLIGGVIGHQFGSGRGRDAMTLVGTLVGSAIASERAVRNGRGHATASYTTRAVPVQRCEVVTERYTEERVEAYRVTYELQGRYYTITTPEPPGEYVRLLVSGVFPGHRY